MIFPLQTALERYEEHPCEEWAQALAASASVMVAQSCRMVCVRVSGEAVCSHCGEKYYDHAEFISTLHLLCDGRIGKT